MYKPVGPKLCEQCDLPLEAGKATAKRVMHDECKLLTVNLSRRCKKCKKVKAASAFSRDASRLEGRFPYCKDCQSKSESKFQNQDDELNGWICPVDDVPIRGHRNRRFCSDTCKNKASGLRKKYGLDIADYRLLVEAAKDECPICLQRPTVWQVDHDHRTRLTTGVVCINCNIGLLAYSGHNIETAERLVAYLKETPADRLSIFAIAPEGKQEPSKLHSRWNYRSSVGKF